MLLFILLPFSSAFYFEIIGTLIIASYIVYGFVRKDFKLNSICLLGILCIGNLMAFKERLHPFPNSDEVTNIPAKIKSGIKSRHEDAILPLERTHYFGGVNHFSLNGLYPLGLSGVSGYWHPSAEFARFHSAVYEYRFEPTKLAFSYLPNEDGNKLFEAMYNINYKFALQGETIRFEKFRQGFWGWIPEKIESLEALLIWPELKKSYQADSEFLFKTLLVSKRGKYDDSSSIENCVSNKIDKTAVQVYENSLLYKVDNGFKGGCSLVVPTSFFSLS